MGRTTAIFAGIAALLGAIGVAEAAAAAHSVSNPLLKTASNFLIVNAAAIIALCAFAETAAASSRMLRIGIAVLLLGTLLFAGELTSHVFLPHSPFVAAAPIGGTLTILGWLIGAVGIFRHARAP
ncbi:DUF423 domain-containing protein [uncultured Methylovirgula sp.]|uniref:DUF423 domain-containing protein n=1 Tax=uncultured Methylovirgula sp. TaxID=1285960 RepID=UPI00260ED4F4|nr:DUF423 domain-containing protein [uncultured Methylovirgula sp.]